MLCRPDELGLCSAWISSSQSERDDIERQRCRNGAYADYPFQKAPTAVRSHTYGGNESGAEGTDNFIDITSCREDRRGLWADGVVGVVLKRKIRREDYESDAHLSPILPSHIA